MATFREDLLEEAAKQLRAAHFDVRLDRAHSVDVPWLLAEDEQSLMAMVATDRLRDLLAVEGALAEELLERVGRAHAGPKKWDVYLLVTSAEGAQTADDREAISAVQQSLRGVRRVVALEVVDASDIRRALTPFLPLPDPPPFIERGALDVLRDELVVNGLSDEDASRFVEVFRGTGSLKDA